MSRPRGSAWEIETPGDPFTGLYTFVSFTSGTLPGPHSEYLKTIPWCSSSEKGEEICWNTPCSLFLTKRTLGKINHSLTCWSFIRTKPTCRKEDVQLQQPLTMPSYLRKNLKAFVKFKDQWCSLIKDSDLIVPLQNPSLPSIAARSGDAQSQCIVFFYK